jgi:hypothetical protein
MSIKHYVGNTEVATIVEVLRELQVAKKLNLPNDSYTGTAVYQHMSKGFSFNEALAVVGVTGYYNKEKLVERAKDYLIRKNTTPEQRKAQNNIIQFIKDNPDLAPLLENTLNIK